MNRTDPKKVVPAVALIVLAAVVIGIIVRLAFDEKRNTPVEQVATGAYSQSAANAKVASGEAQSTPTEDASPRHRREPNTQGREAPAER